MVVSYVLGHSDIKTFFDTKYWVSEYGGSCPNKWHSFVNWSCCRGHVTTMFVCFLSFQGSIFWSSFWRGHCRWKNTAHHGPCHSNQCQPCSEISNSIVPEFVSFQMHSIWFSMWWLNCFNYKKKVSFNINFYLHSS